MCSFYRYYRMQNLNLCITGRMISLILTVTALTTLRLISLPIEDGGWPRKTVIERMTYPDSFTR